jgi:hypothetical protein
MPSSGQCRCMRLEGWGGDHSMKHPNAPVRVMLGVVLFAVACSSSRKVDRLDSTMITSRNPSAPAVDQGIHESCLQLWPQPVRLSGTIHREIKYGPPGYGENPSMDVRVEVFTLALKEAVDVCADTSNVAPQPIARNVKMLQLTEHVDKKDLRQNVGKFVEVFGTVRRQVWPGDYTEALIRVDSIPLLRSRYGTKV